MLWMMVRPSSEAARRQGTRSPVAAVVLAAGASTRLGMPKQLLPLGDRCLVQHVAIAAREGGCDPVLVVIGAYADQIRLVLQGIGVRVVENPRWPEGIASSIRVGVQVLQRGFSVDAVILMVCDQPMVSPRLIQALIDAYRTRSVPIVASAYADTLGVPALFDRSLFSSLTRLTGDWGAHVLIHQDPRRVTAVPFPDGVIDIDTPEDYAHFQTHLLRSRKKEERA